MMASNVGFRTGARLVCGSQIYSENRQEKGRKPQMHKAKLGQRRCCTASLALSAGSPFGTCDEMQTAFTVPAMKRETLVSLGFRVTNCSKIHSFWPNQKLSIKYTLKGN